MRCQIEHPTCDEPALFVLFWTLALAAGLTVFFGWLAYRAAAGPVDVLEVLLSGAICEAIFLGGTLAAYWGLVRTRKIIWLASLLGLSRSRRLPPPPP